MIDFVAEIERLQKKGDFTIEEIKKMDTNFENKIASYYQSIKYIHSFSEQIVIPLSRKLSNLTNKDKHIISIYYCIFTLINSVITLDNVRHFQSIVGSVRSIFELYLDLILISKNIIENADIKYNYFAFVQKYKTAKKLCTFYGKNPHYQFDISQHKNFINENETEIKNNLIKIWDINNENQLKYLTHWSKLNTLEMAQKIDKYLKNKDHEELYIQLYPYTNWYVHSDPTGIIHLNTENVNILIGYVYTYCNKIYLNTLIEYCKSLKLNQKIQDFDIKIDNMKNALGFFVLEKAINGKIAEITFDKNS